MYKGKLCNKRQILLKIERLETVFLLQDTEKVHVSLKGENELDF